MDLLLGIIANVAMLGILAVCCHNLTAPGPNGAWPFGGDW